MGRLMWLDETRRQLIREQLQSALQHWLANWSFQSAAGEVEELTAVQPEDLDHFRASENSWIALSSSSEMVIKHWLFGDDEQLVPNDAVGVQLTRQAARDLLQSLISPFTPETQLSKVLPQLGINFESTEKVSRWDSAPIYCCMATSQYGKNHFSLEVMR